MITNVRKITSKGQITIPAEIREKFGLQPGEKAQFIVEQNEIKVKPVQTLDDLMGSLPTKKKYNKKEVRKIIKQKAAQRYEKTL